MAAPQRLRADELAADGIPLDTRREGDPYDVHTARREDDATERLPQIGSTITRVTEHLNPRRARVEALSAPTEEYGASLGAVRHRTRSDHAPWTMTAVDEAPDPLIVGSSAVMARDVGEHRAA